MRQRSEIAYLWWSLPVTTAAMVVSDPVPAVVGTAMSGGMRRRTFKSPTSCESGLSGCARHAAAALAASIGEPPPMTRKQSQLSILYCAAIFSTVSTDGFGSTEEKMESRMSCSSSFSCKARKCSSAHWRRLAMTNGRRRPFSRRMSAARSKLPSPEKTSGVRQGRKRAPTAKQHWNARQKNVFIGLLLFRKIQTQYTTEKRAKKGLRECTALLYAF